MKAIIIIMFEFGLAFSLCTLSNCRLTDNFSLSAYISRSTSSHSGQVSFSAHRGPNARSSEREVRVGPKEKGQKNVCQNIHVGTSCCCQFSYVPGLKMFFCRRVFACYRSRGFSDLDHASPGPTGLEPQRGPPAHLLVCVY